MTELHTALKDNTTVLGGIFSFIKQKKADYSAPKLCTGSFNFGSVEYYLIFYP